MASFRIPLRGPYMIGRGSWQRRSFVAGLLPPLSFVSSPYLSRKLSLPKD